MIQFVYVYITQPIHFNFNQFILILGDCVMSQWTEFSECSSHCNPKGSKSRIRFEIRDYTGSGRPCDRLRDEVKCGIDVCPDEGFRMDTRDWSSCQPANGECGTGNEYSLE